jgi:hypothetical protein
MHPVLVNLFQGLAEQIDGEDPEKLVRNFRTASRRLKKTINSKRFQERLNEISAQAGRSFTSAVARKLRSYR